MSAETQGSDYLIVESNTTLIAGTDFPIDRRLVIDLIGGGGGGNSGGNGSTDRSQIGINGRIYCYFGNSGLGGLCGEHRTYTFDKNHFANGDVLSIVIGVGGSGAQARPMSSSVSVALYASGLKGYAGTDTRITVNGTTIYEASGGSSPDVVVLARTSYLSSLVHGTHASYGSNGWNTSIPFKTLDTNLYVGGIGGAGGESVNPEDNNYQARGVGKPGSAGGYGSGGGGGGGGGSYVYHEYSTGYIGGTGGNGGNGFVSIRWGEYGNYITNSEVFQPSFFDYSPDIGDCFYGHMQQKILALSSYKNDFINTYEDAIKATNGGNLHTTINGRQCYLPLGDVGKAIMNGGSNAQSVSDFLTNIGYTSEDIASFGSITARPDVDGIRADMSSSPSFRAFDLQFIADEMYDYFQRNQITKISISHRENAYNKNSNGVPTVGISLLESNVNAFTTTVGAIKYTQYLQNGQYCYAPESYYSELNNLIFKKEDGTVVEVHDAVRKASLAMILLSSNNFVTPIGSPYVESVFGIDIELNGIVVHEDFRISIHANFGEIEFQHYAMGTQIDGTQNKKEDLLNYTIDGKKYKNVFCNLVWNSRTYFIESTGSGILQYSSSGTYIDVVKLRDENILDILYTFSQTMTMTVVEEKRKSFWKTVTSGIMSAIIFVVSAYVGQIFNLPSQVISTALSFAWDKIVPPPTMSMDMNNVGTFNVSRRNDSDYEDDDTSTSVDFFEREDEERKNMYNPYIEVRKMNESQYKPYGKGGMMWQQT